ncbi:MAG TPA: ABC transporter permease [Longimicrobium sp.]
MTAPKRGRGFRLPWRDRGEIEREVDEEIAFHLQMRAEELARRGVDPAAARARARAEFGDVAAARRALAATDLRAERTRGRREWLREAWQDAAHGTRLLRRRPVFAAGAVLTLALGIGAATAIVGVADHVLLRPLPYRDPERVVTLWETDRERGDQRQEVSPGNFVEWAGRSRSFAALGLAEPSGFDLTGGGGPPETLPAWRVTEGFLPALGVRPLLGSGFRPRDFHPGAEPVVLLSHALWSRRYGSDPALVGGRIELDGRPATVLGVLPPSLEYPERRDLWAPKVFRDDEPEDRRSSYMTAVARLRPGVSVEEARADLARVAAALARDYPRTNAKTGAAVVPLEEAIFGAARPALLLLLGAVGCLLLIACANVAGLLLARGAERRHELGVRAALGAGRSRLLRQLLAEALLLAVLGGAAGLAVAHFALRLLAALGPAELPRLDAVALDARVAALSLGITLATALLFGVGPALRLSRAAPRPLLGASGRTTTPGRGQGRARDALVVAEVALAMVLLVGAGLLARSFARLLENRPGFAVERRAAVQVFLWDRNPTPEQRVRRALEMAARLEAAPGVDGVGIVSALPFHPHQIAAEGDLRVRGRPASPDGEARVFTTVASPEYFGVMGIPLVRGRPFAAADREGSAPVALVNETLARRFFPGEDPVGQRVTVGVMGPPLERLVVGVVADVRPTALDSDPRPELFVPFAQSGLGSLTFVVRTRGDAASLLPALRGRIWEVDPLQPIYHAGTVRAMVAETLAERRFQLLLLGAFSAAALVLSAVGIYGLVAFATSQRTREFGIRMALGARSRDIVLGVVRQGLFLGVSGVALGLVGSLLLTRFLAGLLYHVSPTDPAVLGQIALLLLGVAALGAYLPARRAAEVDPAAALRGE